MTQGATLDAVDRRLLNQLQSDFPLVAQPFAVLAERLSVDEADVLRRVEALRQAGVLRHLSAIFDVYRVGYRSTLVAFSLPEERLAEAAAVVSAHAGVSHNYGREHEYNLWFVLAAPRSADLEAIVADLAARTRAIKYHILPALKLYKIDVELDVVGGEGNRGARAQRPRAPRRDLTPDDIALVRALQEDLPSVSRPFVRAAEALGIAEEELLEKARALQEEGIMRRFAAVIRHRAAGFTANGMTCWVVPEERLDEVGAGFGAYPQVSHCYRRPTFDDWPYNVFTMIHAQSREKCEETVRRLADDAGIHDYAILYSHTEYKKERVKYYVE
ncbi:MAG TPA: AsnC family transcriptional regulator [Dehalococcoidia bacterium]|nr:AsnC family transcriptional regulator [Dehalococcoidia bacterium]